MINSQTERLWNHKPPKIKLKLSQKVQLSSVFTIVEKTSMDRQAQTTDKGKVKVKDIKDYINK